MSIDNLISIPAHCSTALKLAVDAAGKALDRDLPLNCESCALSAVDHTYLI